jgi:predicted amidohydrolase YtcJ
VLLELEKPGFNPPEGASLERDSSGRLTGFVVGMEEWLSNRLPRVTAAELESRARTFSRELAAAGITAFTDATVRNGPEEMAALAKLSDSGAISQRIFAMLGYPHIEAANKARQIAENSGIRFAGIKFTDVAGWKPGELARIVARALDDGMDCAFHSTEIEELDAVLIAIEAAIDQVSSTAAERCVCRIEHGGLIAPEYPERIAELGVWVVSNPGFIYYRGAKYAAEPGLIPYLYRGRSLISAGVSMAAGSDAPVSPARPLAAIAAAVARVSVEGYELALDEKLTTEEAFALFTRSASRLCRLGAGEIAPGRIADLIVLPTDPLKLMPPELLNLTVEMTIVDGRVVFERGRPPVAEGFGTSLYSG